jgi:perosamine synthetase
VALANGTVALHLALVTKGIGPGDEVLVPDLTFVATASAVRHAGAEPVLIDVRRDDWCMDPELVESAITARTKAMIPVHLFGHPARMDELRSIARRHGLFVLEDAAEAHGATCQGRRVGSLGDAAAFSFYGNKLVTTGEGGAITTNDSDFAARLRFLKDHAMSKERRYFHPEVGFNYRMTNLQAALGCAQLERYAQIRAKKDQILAWYREIMGGLPISMNPVPREGGAVCWLVVGLLPEGTTVDQRERLMHRLRAHHGIDTRPFFVPLSKNPPYAACRRALASRVCVAEDLAARGICLPSSNRLTREDIARVRASLDAELTTITRA